MTFVAVNIGRQTRLAERYRDAPMRGVNRVDNTRKLEGGQFGQVVDNFICRSDGLTVRPGFTVTSTEGYGVTSLLNYPAQVLARTDGDWMGEPMANPGGVHLLAGKGDAAPIHYDGTTWDQPDIYSADGLLDTTKIDGIIQHNGRFFGFLKNDLEVVYLDRRAFHGQAWSLPMHALFDKGGHVAAIASMTNDGGELPGDSLCVATTAGQLAVYDGANPDFRESWRLRGVYDIPKPVGKRAFARMGGTLALQTEDGTVSLPNALATTKGQRSAMTASRTIGAVTGATSVLDSQYQQLALIHAGDEQWVQDAETKGWSRWLHLDATCWLEGHDALYFGRADGAVCKMVNGASDGVDQNGHGITIKTLMIDAFSRFGVQKRKIFRRIRPHCHQAQPYFPRMEFLLDYNNIPSSWDAVRKDHKYWYWPDVHYGMMPAQWERGMSSFVGPWRGIAGHGDAAALVFGAQWLEVEAKFLGYDVEFEGAAGR